MRKLLAGERQRLLADELGHLHLERQVGALARVEVRAGPREGARTRSSPERVDPVARPSALTGMQRVEVAQLRRLGDSLGDAPPAGGGRPCSGRSRPAGPAANTRSATKRSPPPKRSSAARTKRKPSTSSSASSTVRCIRSVSGSRGRWNPGRSTSTSWYGEPLAVRRPRKCAGASSAACRRRSPPCRPASAFTSVDLPTLGRPATATKPHLTARRVREKLARRADEDAPVVVEDHAVDARTRAATAGSRRRVRQ